jgi:hypothetical protein
MEAGTLFDRLHYSRPAGPPEQPPQLNINGGSRLNMIATINDALAMRLL